MTSTSTAKTRGFSLVELSIVLGIAGMLIAGLWAAASGIMENIKREDMYEDIAFTVEKTRALCGSGACDYANAGTAQQQAQISGTGTVITDKLIRAGAIPEEMIRDRSANSLVADHPWGKIGVNGALITDGLGVSDGTANGTGSQTIRIGVKGLPQGACVATALRVSNSNISGLTAVHINGHAVSVPVTAGQTTTYCDPSQWIYHTGALIQFDFRLREPQ